MQVRYKIISKLLSLHNILYIFSTNFFIGPSYDDSTCAFAFPYFRHQETLSWHEAEEFCQNTYGSNLASIHSIEEQQFAAQLCAVSVILYFKNPKNIKKVKKKNYKKIFFFFLFF